MEMYRNDAKKQHPLQVRGYLGVWQRNASAGFSLWKVPAESCANIVYNVKKLLHSEGCC
jgi:hypothetical protein